MKKLLLIALVIVILLLLIVACTNKEENTEYYPVQNNTDQNANDVNASSDDDYSSDEVYVDLDPNDGATNIIVPDLSRDFGVGPGYYLVYSEQNGTRTQIAEFEAMGEVGPEYFVLDGKIYTDYITFLETPAPITCYELIDGVLEKIDCASINIDTENTIAYQDWLMIKNGDSIVANSDLDYVLKEGDKVIIRDINETEEGIEVSYEKEDGVVVIAIYK